MARRCFRIFSFFASAPCNFMQVLRQAFLYYLCYHAVVTKCGFPSNRWSQFTSPQLYGLRSISLQTHPAEDTCITTEGIAGIRMVMDHHRWAPSLMVIATVIVLLCYWKTVNCPTQNFVTRRNQSQQPQLWTPDVPSLPERRFQWCFRCIFVAPRSVIWQPMRWAALYGSLETVETHRKQLRDVYAPLFHTFCVHIH